MNGVPSETVATDLLVVGGGMTGLALALACAEGGLSVAVVEPGPLARQKEAAFDGRVSAIALGSKRMLDVLGLWDRMALKAEPILEIRVTDDEAPLFLHYDHRDVGPDPLGYIVENRVIRAALVDALEARPAIRCFAPARLASLERSGSGVRARLADGTELRARLVAACDGKNSALRTEAGIPTLHWRYPQEGIVCTVAHERPHRGIAVEKFLPAGPFAILPMTGNRSSIVWTERSSLVPAIMALDDESFAAELRFRFGDHLGALSLAGPRWSYPLSLSHAQRYADLRLALVGDAAHAIHPIAGQGFNLGLRGVAALAQVLTDAHRLGLDIGTPDRLEGYACWRRFDALVLACVTDGLNRLFSNDVLAVKLARRLGLAAVNRLPAVKRLFMRHAMGTLGDLPRLVAGRPL